VQGDLGLRRRQPGDGAVVVGLVGVPALGAGLVERLGPGKDAGPVLGVGGDDGRGALRGEPKAGTAVEVTVTQLRGWIGEEQPALPEQVQSLLIACYAVQADKAWLRAGHPAEPPRLDKMPDDLVLRSQELPTPEEFDLASARAAGIFRIQRQPVRTARVGARAGRRHPPRRQGMPGGGQGPRCRAGPAHGDHSGLDDDADRRVTSRVLTGLVSRLVVITDDTQTVRVLAAADLPRTTPSTTRTWTARSA
jgi:hypothetical protein